MARTPAGTKPEDGKIGAKPESVSAEVSTEVSSAPEELDEATEVDSSWVETELRGAHLGPVVPPPTFPSAKKPPVPVAPSAAAAPARPPPPPRPATPVVDVDDPIIGTLIGNMYRIVRRIGEGETGRVYEAHHIRLKDRMVAVKCLHAHLARVPETAERFRREAELASAIKHENLVDVLDVDRLADGTPFFVCEYLDGETLAEFMEAHGALDPRTAAGVARQICSALALAHSQSLLHRGLRLEEVFILESSIAFIERGESRSLRVKVLDLGLSKAADAPPTYMSPEQARGGEVDNRTDVYSIGACLYAMVTGQPPFDSDDPAALSAMVANDEPTPAREAEPRVPEALETVIQRAMAKNPDERFATVADLDRALAEFTRSSTLAPGSGRTLGPSVPPAALPRVPSVPPEQMRTGAATPRQTIIVMSTALGAWLFGATVAALAGILRVAHGGEVTFVESLLLVVGCVCAAAAPVALYVSHLQRVWGNAARAAKLAKKLERATLAVLVSYGGLSILGRIFHTVLWRNSFELASGAWDIALALVSLGAVLYAGGWAWLRSLLQRYLPKNSKPS
jgi:serine/threonine-protein kinase